MDPVDPTLLAALCTRAKQQIRQRMRALRRALPESARVARSTAIALRLLDLDVVHDARAVALFSPILSRGEVDLRPVDSALRAAGKQIFYPYMEPLEAVIQTGFRHVEDLAELSDRGQGFLEPPATARVARRGELDVVIVPALAVSATGHRVGYGAGFYDATLPDVRPPAVAIVVAYAFQLLAELPVEPSDVACDLVLTDRQTLEPRADR
jgi:5-formyltetrahydrofolate cyclo-ligase